MKKFFRFLISRQFLLNVAGIIFVWILIVWIEGMYLKNTTSHGESIEVPSFYKIHMDDLDEFVRDKQLEYEIVDSVYLDEWPKGTVCWQYPKPTDSTGMSIKSGRTIQLSVVPLSPQMVRMPKVVHMSKRMGETTLNALGIKTKISFKPDPVGKDFILEQLYNGQPIDSGTFIPKGSRIELVVAKGKSGDATPLPSVVGLTINEAKQRFSTLSLSLHPQCENCMDENQVLNAVITRQSPAGGANVQVAAGTTVTVWATYGAGGATE
ncbi:PASTA domain-containing protein [Paracrocinitomix mangrovi]|uniref:PASTA domain-containing protein n=1 Tax=Paracrocinitomix mangrovi TaxID=2862509 RepID=UPI001C8D9F2E|nr:PASTA domain-containing protein [Paracrocinitomix mangrovi]UKN01003.1 PASTA domain-containing protein [Paracrocinitomix mangrovi]